MLVGLGLGMGISATSPISAAAGGLGPELIDNGNFGDASDWTLNSRAAIAAGKLTFLATGVGTASSDGTDVTMTEGLTYRAVFTVDSISTGTVFVVLGDTVGTLRATAGTFSQDIVCGLIEGVGFSLTSDTSNAVVDVVSCKQVL